ncbi:MAG: UDP-4-amino-4,6-dideoxy-N-acetyl-beta-L-altrosamine transaminase [Bacteroidota bacterium]
MKLPIPYGCQDITAEDIQTVTQAIGQELITQGAFLPKLEAAFSSYLQASYGVAVANGTAALHLSALALGWEKGSKVICSPLTFVASANCILYAGAQVDFVDIDPDTGLMDLALLEKKLTQSPRGTYQGIVPVDYAGHPIRMDKVAQLAKAYDLKVLEDSCHAPGGFFQDSDEHVHPCGSGAYADLAIFSFHPVKHITTAEGGMVTTRNPKLAEKIKTLRNHGIIKEPNSSVGGWYYEMQELGFNYRMSELQAALGYSQVQRAKANLSLRKQKAQTYDQQLADLPIQLPEPVAGHAYHLYVIRTDRRRALYDYLHAHQILVQVHYIPVHLQPYYQQMGWKKGDFPQAESFYEQCLSLPLFPQLTEAQQAYVVDKIKAFFR